MAFRRSATVFSRGPVTQAYKLRVTSGNLHLDKEQLSLASRLDSLHESLVSTDRYLNFIPGGVYHHQHHLEAAARYYGAHSHSIRTRLSSMAATSFAEGFAGVAIVAFRSFFRDVATPKGVYVHGSVGVGKSMLVDMFHDVCADDTISQRKRRRCHFHEFMLDVHRRLHRYKAKHPRCDPVPPVAASLVRDAQILCFDEFQITDIADAMIVKRLFTILMDLGVVIVTTSNRPPEALYEGGINRSVFVPFIQLLNDRMSVIEVRSIHDYRRDKAVETAGGLSIPAYISPSNSSSSTDILEQWFECGSGETREEVIPVAMGRSIQVNRGNDNCGWFTFEELCNRPLGAADYLALAERFSIVLVENVPQLCSNTYNEARRFVILLDALYEAKTKIIISAHVPREDLFVGFDAEVTTNDGDEEIAVEKSSAKEMAIYDNNGEKESFVIREGGSSSSCLTTMIKTKDGNVEWSATGRIGVSLAQLSAVKEVSFSFRRAESRLVEMGSSDWGRHKVKL